MEARTLAAIIVLIAIIAGATLYLGSRGGEEAPQGVEQEKPVIRAATLQGGISTLDLIESEGLLEERGYQLEVLRLQKTPNILDAIVKGETDLAVIPAEMAAKLIERGEDLVIVAVDMLQNQAVLVRGDSDIESVEDLQGRLVGAVVASGTFKLFTAYVKEIYGINVTVGSEPQPGVITVVNAPPGSLLDILEQGQVDAVVVWEPMVSIGITRGMKVLATFQELWRAAGVEGEPVMLVWVARGEFARNNEDALKAFLDARSEAARIWNTDKAKVVSVLVNLYNMSEDAAQTLYDRVEIVEGNLTPELVDSIRAEWVLAWKGGYLEQDPAAIPDSVFYVPEAG